MKSLVLMDPSRARGVDQLQDKEKVRSRDGGMKGCRQGELGFWLFP